LRISWKKAGFPGFSSIIRFEYSQPGVPCGGPLRNSWERTFGLGHIDRAIIIAAEKKMERISRGSRPRRFVLSLEIRVAVRQRLASDHVDIPTDDEA
jgi:hypothetical protein